MPNNVLVTYKNRSLNKPGKLRRKGHLLFLFFSLSQGSCVYLIYTAPITLKYVRIYIGRAYTLCFSGIRILGFIMKCQPKTKQLLRQLQDFAGKGVQIGYSKMGYCSSIMLAPIQPSNTGTDYGIQYISLLIILTILALLYLSSFQIIPTTVRKKKESKSYIV